MMEAVCPDSSNLAGIEDALKKDFTEGLHVVLALSKRGPFHFLP